MPYRDWLMGLAGFVRRHRLLAGLAAAVACSALVFGFHEARERLRGMEVPADTPSLPGPSPIQTIRPQRRTIIHRVGQPSFVESYERTAIYPKVTGYIEEWRVDIGDKVKKGDLLGTLFVPELREDWETKKRTVRLDQERIDLARQRVKVAEADVKAAQARVAEAKAILGQYQAAVDRWDSEVKRLAREVKGGVVDPQVLLESQNQWKSNIAARNAAQATILKAEADLLSKQAVQAQDEVAVQVAERDLAVAQSDAKRLEAWVGYLTLSAPYDGIIVARNANTWDFVTPRFGDPSADPQSPDLAPSRQAAPIWVIDRTDVVRIFVDIPETSAKYVQAGTKASVQVRAFQDEWFPATVTRTAWALNVKSRTLRAEIDLRNSEQPAPYRDTGRHPIARVPANNGLQILPGMYAYAEVIVERPNVWALPESAVIHQGGRTFYREYVHGHLRKVEVQTGLSDGEWVEVTRRRLPPQAPWKRMDEK